MQNPTCTWLDALGWTNTRRSCWIQPKEFHTGNTLYVFDLSPDAADDAHWELLREGTTTVNIKFANPIPQNGAYLIVLAEFDNLLTVDRFRNVYADYTP